MADASPASTVRARPAGLGSSGIGLSVIAPAHNEEANIAPLVQRVGQALVPTGLAFEFIIVDDGSTDQTRARLEQLLPAHPWLRAVALTRTPAGRGNGQSAAIHAGVRASRGELVAMLDADLQNDPADLPRMIELLRTQSADLVQGDRSANRRDNPVRKVGSWVGRQARALLLGDRVRDTGCSLRVMRREYAMQLPLEFRGMHRFVPVMVASLGGKIVEVPVTHHPRVAGVTKYGLGIVQRALPGLRDLLVVRWMRQRRRSVEFVELPRGQG